MVTFKEYLLEYKTKENSLISGIVGLKSGLNGKSFDRAHMRKNPNTIRKEYTPKHNIPSGVVKGRQLETLLNNYKITFKPGEKHLGNSSTTINMYIDEAGEKCGLVRKGVQ
jgi:hypothetical protein